MSESELPKGTTMKQWKEYELENVRFEIRMALRRPYYSNCINMEQYNKSMQEWEQSRSMDAPNKPGYYRANND